MVAPLTAVKVTGDPTFAPLTANCTVPDGAVLLAATDTEAVNVTEVPVAGPSVDALSVVVEISKGAVVTVLAEGKTAARL